MPRTDSDLKSSPVELPSRKPEPVKRTHSSSSIASLPTPPRTRKRKRSHSRHSRATDSDSELDNVADSHDELPVKSKPCPPAVFHGHKKRKILNVDAIAAELSGQAAEDAFWMSPSTTVAAAGPSEPKAKAKSKLAVTDVKAETDSARQSSRSPTRSPSSSPPARLLTRTRTGLLSPPKSRRHRSSVPRRLLAIPDTIDEAPVTPSSKTLGEPSVRRKLFPERDSPNNPFLVSGSAASKTSGSPSQETDSTPSRPRTPVRHIEKPTLTYVFRGVRQEFENPLYDPRYPETGVAPVDPESPSNLPPEDPDFSPSDYCAPKLLFPEARTRSEHKRRAASEAASDVEDKSLRSPPLPRTPRPAAKKARVDVRTTTTERKPASQQGKGKGKERVRSEWDTSDEEGDVVRPASPTPRLRTTRARSTVKTEKEVIKVTEIKPRPQTRSQATKVPPSRTVEKRQVGPSTKTTKTAMPKH